MLRARISPLLPKAPLALAHPAPIRLRACHGLRTPIAARSPLINASSALRPPTMQLARVFTTTALTRQNKVPIPPTPVKIGEAAKQDDKADHSAPSELQTDIKKVGEMFGGVPAPALVAGLVGVLPYAATSLGTLLLTWDINAATSGNQALHSQTASHAYYLDPATAQHLLDIIQPIQIGYGAVLLSFLGAIHWGLEFAGVGGHLGFRRYFLGILAPTLAWPTILLPVNFALVVQFFGFTGMYWADNMATRHGWAPPWYNGYRFVLTFIVCTSIVFSLIVKEHLIHSESTHGQLVNLKLGRKNVHDDDAPEQHQEEQKPKKKGKKAKKQKKDEDEDED